MAEVRKQVEIRVDFAPGRDPVDLEREIASEGRRAARELYELVLQIADEQSAASWGGARQRREPRWLTTCVGRIRIFRYRVRVRDGASLHPLDRIMDLNRSEASAAVRTLVVGLARNLSYREIAALVEELTGEAFSHQQVARIVKQSNGGHRQYGLPGRRTTGFS